MTRKVAISEGDMLLTKLQKGPLALKSNLQVINRSWLFLIKDTGIKHHNKKPMILLSFQASNSITERAIKVNLLLNC